MIAFDKRLIRTNLKIIKKIICKIFYIPTFIMNLKTKLMATITLGGNPVKTSGNLPAINSKALDFKLIATDLSTKTIKDFLGYNLILNIFPSVNTAVCSASEGIENVIMLSDFKNGTFGNDYGLIMNDGIFDGLLSRCVIITNEKSNIIYTEQVQEIGEEPNYEKALELMMN